jgi:hypothetical protein
MSAHDRLEAERFDGVLADMGQGVLYRVRRINEPHVLRTDRARSRHFLNESKQLAPIIGAHHDDREVFDLPSLDQRQRLE